MAMITLNGKKVDIPSSSLYELIETKGMEMGSLVIEYNGAIIKKEKWQSIHIKDNDEIELLNFVGGG